MGFLGQAVLFSGGRAFLVTGQLRGDTSDERLFLAEKFFSGAELQTPIYRAVSRSVFDTAPVVEAVVGRKHTPKFVGEDDEDLKLPPILNIGKERALLCRIHQVDSSNHGRRAGGYTLPIGLETYFGDEIPVVEVVRDRQGRFVETVVHGYAKTHPTPRNDSNLQGVILPCWNPNKNGGRQATWLFCGEEGLALMQKNQSRFVSAIQEIQI